MVLRLAAAGVLALAAVSLAAAPRAISEDPPIDRAHPASGTAIQFESKGARVNAQLYLPAGVGPHRAVILLHGFPGNEQNLDLARAIQRAGWAVVTFHYRGSWGSGGSFTLEGGCDDVDALLADIAAKQSTWHVDAQHIAVIGHSYGGFVAACVMRRHSELMAAGLIAPWDIGHDAVEFRKMTAAQARKRAPGIFDDVNGRVVGTDAVSLMQVIRNSGNRFSLNANALALAGRPLLIATASRDNPDDQAIDLLPAIRRNSTAQLTYREFETDHSFNDQRIALETFVLEWLATLPQAPSR